MATLNQIVAKWPGKCAASGQRFQAGATVLHDPVSRLCYLPGHEPTGSDVQTPAVSEAYKAGWEAGAPGAAMTRCPHRAGSDEAKMWQSGLRDRHASGN